MTARRQWIRVFGGVVLALIGSGCQTPVGPQSNVNRPPVGKLSGNKSTAASTTERAILPETYLAAGRLHESQDRLEQAIGQYRLATQVKPDCVEAFDRLGSVLDRLGRFKDAEQAHKQAVRLAPDQVYLHNNLGFSYVMQRRWQDAEKCFKKSLELKGDFARARVNLGLALAQQERFEEALAEFTAALPPEDAQFNMGLMYQSKRKPVEAARAYKTALKLNPGMVAARNHLKGLPTEAMSKADEMIRAETVASPLPAQPKAAQVVTQDQRPSTQPAPARTIGWNSDVPDLVHPIPRVLAEMTPSWLEQASELVIDRRFAVSALLCGRYDLFDWMWLFDENECPHR